MWRLLLVVNCSTFTCGFDSQTSVHKTLYLLEAELETLQMSMRLYNFVWLYFNYVNVYFQSENNHITNQIVQLKFCWMFWVYMVVVV